MLRLRTLCLICVFVFLFLTTSAFAANTVSSFTISGSPITGYTNEYVTGTITIARDPGTSGAVPVALSFTGGGWSSFVCNPPPNLPYSQGCYVPNGSNSVDVKIYGACVAAPSVVNVTAGVEYNPQDPGMGASMTVNPLAVSVSISPTVYFTGTNQVGNGTVSVNAPLRDWLGVTLAWSNPAVGMLFSPNVRILKDATSANFTLQAQSAPQVTNTNLTATLSSPCGSPAATPMTVIPGGEPNLGVCTECEAIAGEPLNLSNGNVWIRQQDYALPGLGGGLEVTRTWNSLWRAVTYIELNGAFGEGWRSTYEERLGFLAGGHKKYWREDGSAWIFTYDSVMQAYTLLTPADERGWLTYDSGTTKFTLTFLDGSKRIFNSGGYLTAVQDRNGNQTTITLTAANRPYQVTDAAGRWVRHNYDAYARITSLQDATGTLATYTWNGYQLSRVTYADGSFLNYNYGGAYNQLITSVTDTNGKVVEAHTYDPATWYKGKTSERANLVDKLTVTYTSNSVTRLTDSKGNITDYTFTPRNGRQFITSITGSGCASCGGRGNSSFTYDANGNRTSATDALGRVTTFTYDAMGNVLTKSQVVGGQTLTWSYTYNAFGQVLTATDSLGKTTTNTYDVKGNLLTTTTPSPDGTTPGSVTSFLYDTLGQLTRVTDPRGNQTNITYTTAGLIATVTDADNKVTTFEYDARGNRTAVVDALNNRTTFTYNTMNRLTRITYPDLTHSDFVYDTRGRRTSVTDQNGKVTSYAYDDADRLTTVTDAQTPSAGVTTYAYDSENNLTSIMDALGRATSFTYDSYGRVTKTTFPSTLEETYTYDAMGNLLSKKDRKDQTINYFYDALNRLTSKSYPDSTSVTYTYDAGTRLTQVSDATGTYQFAYDSMGRLTGTTTDYSFLTSRTFTNGYQYDATSNRTRFTDPEGGQTDYVYDVLNRLTSLTNFSAQTFNFSYDALGRRTQLTRPNGVNTDYNYDNLSRLLSVLHKLGAQTIDGATYTVDAVGNRTSKLNHINGVTENYTYDAIYQLAQVVQNGTSTTEAYSYDKVGNRLSTLVDSGWAYNNSNQLTSRPGVSYTYDANGNTLTKTEASSTTTYAWDYENRLTSVTLPGGGLVSFKYDPMGRRIQRVSSSGTINYVYDGADGVEEVDAAGTVLARYAMGPGIDQPLSMLRGGATSYYEADGLSSVTSLTDGTGSAVGSYLFDTFGKQTSPEGGVTNAFRYTARESDVETGLYNYRARYYDPQIGMFISEDPTRFASGANFYTYAANTPTQFNDPTGYFPTQYHHELTSNIGNEVFASKCRGLVNIIADENAEEDATHGTWEFVQNIFGFGPAWEKGGAHFPSQALVANRLNGAFSNCDAKLLGRAMHSLQDSYAHSGSYARPRVHWLTSFVTFWVGGYSSADHTAIIDAATRSGVEAETRAILVSFRDRCYKCCK